MAEGKPSWKDRLKAGVQSATDKGKELAEQAKSTIAEQNEKRVEQWKNDPETLWFGHSQNPATKATGVSKAYYRVTRDRVWIETGVLGVRSEYAPLWAVLCIAGMVGLPWAAVLIANDRAPLRRSERGRVSRPQSREVSSAEPPQAVTP